MVSIIKSKRGYVGNLLLVVAISFPILIAMDLLLFKSWPIVIGFMAIILVSYVGEKRVVQLDITVDSLRVTYYHWLTKKVVHLALLRTNVDVLRFSSIMGKFHKLRITAPEDVELVINSRDGFNPDDFPKVAQAIYNARLESAN
jgi:hypothetical protein